MMSTARANLSVGPPYDAGVYRTGTFALDQHRFTADSPVLAELREVGERNILRAVAEMPEVEVAELSDETAAGSGTSLGVRLEVGHQANIER